MKNPAPADLQRWSEELARNPASLAFLPLARAYRRLGRRDLALQLCLRGLEQHPTHVEAHALLALLHFEAGERAKAADEWATVLRLKPGNFEALRGMGFRYLEQNDIVRARQHLERAALIRPEDATVQEALRLIRQRENAEPTERAAAGPLAAAVRTPRTEARPTPGPAAQRAAPRSRFLPAGDAGERAAPPAPPPHRAKPAPWAADAGLPADPSRLFEGMVRTGPLLGVLLLDRRGLVLAGGLRESAAADELGALIGAAIDEAVRTVEHLDLGAWKTLMLECAAATIHVAPVGAEAMVVVAARRGAPMGWVMRSAMHAVGLAERFMEAYA